MRVRVLAPTRSVVDAVTDRVVVESTEGSFCMRQRHLDLVAVLVPGILTVTDGAGEETFVAVDGGTVVKCGDAVTVATPRAVVGPLDRLRQTVDEDFRQLDDRERAARAALARLEADVLHGTLRLDEGGRA